MGGRIAIKAPAARVRKLFSRGSIKKLFPARSTPGFAVISRDANWIKILYAKGGYVKPQICLLKVFSIKDMSEEAIASSVRKIFSEAGLAKVHLGVSSASIFTRARLLKLPSADPKELIDMVDLLVDKYSPDGKEETLSYFRVADTSEDGYTKVFLVMAHRDVVQSVVRTAQASAAKLKAISSDVDGLINWFSHYQKSQKEKSGAVVLADIDSDHTTIMVLDNGEACFHRSFPIGAAHLDQEGEAGGETRLVDEVHRSFTAFKDEGLEIKISQIVLTGLGAEYPHIAAIMEKEEACPVHIVPSFSGFDLSGDAKEVPKSVSFTSLLGYISGPVQGDLTPPALKLQWAIEKRIRSIMIFTAQLLMGVLMLAAILLRNIDRDTRHEKWLKTQAQSMEEEAANIESALLGLKTIKERLKERGDLLGAIVDMHQSTPDQVQWEGINYTKDEGVVLKGVSTEMAEVFRMVTNLEKSALFLRPKVKQVAKRKVNDKDITAFDIEIPFFKAVTDEMENS